MSPQASTLLILAMVIVGIRLLSKGKLSGAWTALWSSPPGGSGGGGAVIGPGGGQGSTAGGASTGGVPPASAFGLSNVTSAFHQTGWLAADGPIFGPAGVAVDELNYLLPAGAQQPVKLPGGPNTQWRFVSQVNQPGVGWIQRWEAPNGGNIAFLHLSSVGQFFVGQPVEGGVVVGRSGWPTGSQFAVGGITGPANAHLAVAMDALGRGFLNALFGS